MDNPAVFIMLVTFAYGALAVGPILLIAFAAAFIFMDISLVKPRNWSARDRSFCVAWVLAEAIMFAAAMVLWLDI